jgi:hypothetical protein
MNRPTPSLAILAFVAVALALIFFGRKYLWPEQRADVMGRAAVAGYSRRAVTPAPDQDDSATVAGMIDAGRMWAKAHKPNSAAGCPALPLPFHQGCADAAGVSNSTNGDHR